MREKNLDNVASCGYIECMKTIKTVGIRKLKDNISGYLREVRSGTIILITDRDRVVAELHEPVVDIDAGHDLSAMSEWIMDGKLQPARTKKKKCPASPVNMKNGTAAYLLDRDREE